jgi:hypothetical protein
MRLRSPWGITAKFELQRGGKVTIAVDMPAFDRFKNELLPENVSPEKLRQLAQLVASMHEEELFTMGESKRFSKVCIVLLRDESERPRRGTCQVKAERGRSHPGNSERR